MSYVIKVTHNIPTYGQFREWGIGSASPKFHIDINFCKNKKDELSFKIEITGEYYCSGSQNFDESNMSLHSYKISNAFSKERVGKLLRGNKLKTVLEKSIKGTIVSDDHIRILEKLWADFDHTHPN